MEEKIKKAATTCGSSALPANSRAAADFKLLQPAALPLPATEARLPCGSGLIPARWQKSVRTAKTYYAEYDRPLSFPIRHRTGSDCPAIVPATQDRANGFARYRSGTAPD